MAKRGAGFDLNQDNWDSVDEKEEAGSFTPCSATELQNRKIKKAKRSLTKSDGSSNSPGITPFAKFTGFSSTGSSPFGPTIKAETSKFNSPFSTSVKEVSVPKTDASSLNSHFSNSVEKEEKSNGTVLSSQETGSGDTKPSTSNAKQIEIHARSLEYYRQLQSLNESVLKWMQLHTAKNPCCDFTPVFNDYKKHMDILNVTYPVKTKETSSFFENKSSVSKPSTAEVSKDSTNHSGSSNDNSNLKKEKLDDETDYGAHFKSNTTNTSTFSFGIKSTPTATSLSSIGCTSSSKEGKDAGNEEKAPASFSFGFFSKAASQSNSDKPFSFACTSVEKQEAAENEETEYVPPKNEFVAVTEDDAVYNKRCKLFFKKNDSYVERGIGNLYLKPNDGKTQLLIRADTSLGNILLNIMLSASLPMSRTGKNNVLLVCIPNPPVDAKKSDSKEAIPMLIRVKTSEEADELLETLNKYKS